MNAFPTSALSRVVVAKSQFLVGRMRSVLTCMPLRRVPALAAVFLVGGMAAAWGANTYYVDYAGGDDGHDGLDPDRAFQHAPVDPQATGQAAEVDLEPGDVLRFRGGVAYRGSLVLTVSGEEGNPIVLDGNTAGDFGEGRAILDGGQVIEGWQPAASAAEVGGNPNWERIFYADIEVDISSQMGHGQFVNHRTPPRNREAPWQRVLLFDGEDGLLPISQSPKPSDRFFPDHTPDFYVSPHELDVRPDEKKSLLTDEERLTAEAADAYTGRFIGVHGGNNHVYFAVVRGYDPETHTLTLPHFKPDTYGVTRYAFYNAVDLIDQPGEWAIRPIGNGRSRVYFWPERLVDGRPDNIAFPVFGGAVKIQSAASHLKVQNFLIQRYAGSGIGIARTKARSQDIAIADCEIRFLSGGGGVMLNHCDDIHIRNAYIHHNPGWTVGIYINRVNDFEVRDNRLVKNAGSGIRHYEAKRGILADNVVLDHTGMHAGGMNLYAFSEDLLLARNVVHDSNIALTMGNVRRIHLVNNILTANGTAIGIWPHRYNEDIHFLNNYIYPGINITHKNAKRLVFKNNVIGRLDGFPPNKTFTMSHNLYLQPKQSLTEGEFIVEDVDRIARDAPSDDFRPVPASPTIDMGTDVRDDYPRDVFPTFDFDVDFAGNPRLHGEAIDIGPYEREYEPGELDKRGAIATGADAEPAKPIDNYSAVPGAEPVIVHALDYTDEGEGSVRKVPSHDQARFNHVRFWNAKGHWLAYRVEVPEAGEYRLRLRYAADFDAPRKIEVNGEAVVEETTLAKTGGWGTFRSVEIDTPLPLEAGTNTLRLVSLGGRGCNLDMLELMRGDESVVSVSAGDFDKQGGGEVDVVPAPHHGLFSHWNAADHWLEWTVDVEDAGLYKIVVRYATLATSPRSVHVNGEPVEGLESFILERTPGWRHCAEAALPAPVKLAAGRNVIRITSLGGAGLNLDELRFIPVE